MRARASKESGISAGRTRQTAKWRSEQGYVSLGSVQMQMARAERVDATARTSRRLSASDQETYT